MLCSLFVVPQLALGAVVPADSVVRAREFAAPELRVQTQLIRGSESARVSDLDALMVPADLAFADRATGRWATLIPTQPLIPGGGVGNQLRWSDLERTAPGDDAELAAAAEAAFRDYVSRYADELGLSVDEFAPRLNVSVLGDTILVHAPRIVGGVPVRNSFVTATLNHGNLILMGAARWGEVTVSPRPALAEADARNALSVHLAGLPIDGQWGDSELVFVPFSRGDALSYRLVYSLKPSFADDSGRWEGLVDAHNGELLSFRDTNHYATRHVVGGVYPISNDGDGPEGREQARWPMPFADLNGNNFFTDSGGNFPGEFNGEVTTTLNGLYIDVDDSCGQLSESSTGPNDIDLGVSGGDDCEVPPGASPGNTHSSRTTFYEANRVAEWARSRWPANSWLNDTLTANVNLNFTCNAFWSGAINMFRSGGGCGNTGELAGVIDHEWGHGLDDNDNNPSISFPGEGIADLYAALRLDDSCIGRGFFQGGNCNGYGDPCIDCSGVRDIDFTQRQSGQPHDLEWANANCSGGCNGFNVHCLGAVYAEAVWELAKFDLPNQFGANASQALEMTTWYTILGAANVGDWFTCGLDGEDGCAAEGGYLNYLTADDDDGSLANGTPHMSAIFNAFDRHGIACSTPAVQNNGCENAPNDAPVVTASAGDSSVTLSWDAVPGATRYHVFRAEGTKQCDKGKTSLGRTSGTSFTDDELLNGFEYYYTVIPANGAGSCVGPASDCTAATPE